MTTPARRARPALAALALAVPFVVAGAPAVAAPPTVVYDALGDSYAAGFGTAPVTPPCARSPLAYPEVLDGRMRIDLDDFAACSGAVAAPVGNTIYAQLGALDAETDLVTISIGGNDVGWGAVVVACLGGSDAQCDGAITAARTAVTTVLPGLLDDAYTAVDAAAPDAHVVVTGYPHLFSPEYGPYLGASVLEQEALNAAADLLNSVIAAEALEAGFQYVDVTKRFAGHGANSPDAWISPANFHPTADGQNAYAAALTAAINPRDLR
ncbi:SGNH/GDSL hydrolase family protein [Ornithinimicrobium cerasi]|uniref:Lysophospholipase L1 n=1 Tax=Ornithinimicrobium cerasi TaxID=2248773 RepID=A0A285VEX9_9MICO|nr:SGNH/GDSL hydrolase family protein [Ornithinimicrobium cerasi]SOC52629.1 Lysophospholipase L1 [Ornithinimicrobium cerasi]